MLGAQDIPEREPPWAPAGLGSPRTGAAAGQSSGSATSPCRGDEVISVASMNYDPIVSKVAEVLASGRTIRKREVE